jgi:hypothetical protein
MTVAGSDASATANGCAAMVAPWQPIITIPAGEYLATAGCFDTVVPGATIRVYTAEPNGNAVFTQAVCKTFIG